MTQYCKDATTLLARAGWTVVWTIDRPAGGPDFVARRVDDVDLPASTCDLCEVRCAVSSPSLNSDGLEEWFAALDLSLVDLAGIWDEEDQKLHFVPLEDMKYASELAPAKLELQDYVALSALDLFSSRSPDA